ncbi:MAG: VCBS repeat-containing protein, partial [Candidatus Hydrogenedentes bacterium]|nr:VCBS repeat-containing protein [Candidatus Hydrogenedentota bacterium]
MKKAGLFLTILALISISARAQTFTEHSKTYQVGPNPNAIAAADLNDDGIPDLVTANTGELNDPRQERPANDELSLLLSSAPLEYVVQPPLKTDFGPYALAVANVDGKQAPDIVAASFLATYNRDITLFRSMGGGLFEPTSFTVPDDTLPYNRMLDGDNEPVFTKPGITSIILPDINKDGFRDIIATAWSSDALIYIPGEDATWFGKPQFTLAASGPRDVAAADFDNDKNLDLAVALYTSGEVGLWKGNGEGVFEPITRFSSRGKLPTTIRLADLNGDDKIDIIVSHCHTDDSIVIFYGDGGFSFSVSQEILLGEQRNVLEHEIRDLVVQDLNADGHTDIAAACYGSKKVILLINSSSGSSVPQTFSRETYPFDSGRPRTLCAADFNKDGAIDIAAALWDANAVALLLGTPKKPEEPKPAAKTATP